MARGRREWAAGHSGPIPTLGGGPVIGWVRVANVTTGLVLDSGGNVASGSNLK
jgi:alpha-L-fucosidase